MPIDGEKVNGETNVLERRRLVIDLGGGLAGCRELPRRRRKVDGWPSRVVVRPRAPRSSPRCRKRVGEADKARRARCPRSTRDRNERVEVL